MKKVKVLLAIKDELYCERIEEYIQETKFSIELGVITDEAYLISSWEKESADIILISSDFIGLLPAQFLQRPNVFILSQFSAQDTKLKYINPYQKTEFFLREVLLKYSELTGETSFLIEEHSGKKIISFYSPCGGSGKTTLALALAASLASIGKKVFYLNLDPFSGNNLYFDEMEKGGFSNVLLALKQSIANQSLLAVSRNIKAEKKTKVMYFSDLENPCDLFEMGEAEAETLLLQMAQMNDLDLLLIDLGGSFSEQTKKVLAVSDHIFLPILDTPGCRKKVENMKEAAAGSEYFEDILKKSTWILNQYHGQMQSRSEWSEIFSGEYFTIAKIASLEKVQRIDQISAYLNDSIQGVAAKILEG